MKPVNHPSNTRTLQPPAGWDQGGLPVEPLGITDQWVEGILCVWSFWRPDAEELAALNAGGYVVLSIVGRTMPPAAVMVTVPEPVHDKRCPAALNMSDPCNCGEVSRPRDRKPEAPNGWDQKCLPEGLLYRLPPLVLSGRQLLEALNLVAPERLQEQLESEVCIAFRPAGIDMDDDRHEAGLCCWLSEYPEEGSIPLEGNSSLATQPPAELESKRPVNCGTGHCSCIECPFKQGTELSEAACDVIAERHRQVSSEGWTPEHDDEHVNDEIAAMAAFYAMPPGARDWPASETGYGDTLGEAIKPDGWDDKAGDRRRELVKAGALIIAEIERLDRAARGVKK